MRVIGFSGWSGAGKTTLLARLIPALRERGFSVSTIKHAHHGFDLDQPGKDSHRHRTAGATEVLVSSSRRWALLHELRDEPEPLLEDLLRRLTPVDLVLVEGFKRDRHRKIEIHRAETGKPFLYPGDPAIAAVATDVVGGSWDGPTRVHIDDIAAVAALVLDLAMPLRDSLDILADGHREAR